MGKKNYHQSSQSIQRKNACHFEPKAKYPIKVDEEKGNIIYQHEQKRRLYEKTCFSSQFH